MPGNDLWKGRIISPHVGLRQVEFWREIIFDEFNSSPEETTR